MLGGELIKDILDRGRVVLSVFEGCNEVWLYFSLHVPWSCDHFLHTL